MPEVSIRDQIRKLVELQTIDYEAYSLRRELNEKPALIARLQEKSESKKLGLKKLEEQWKAIQLDRKAKELELQGKEAEIIKANAQLFQLKTNKEYQARLLEIEHLKADKSILEEKILLLFDEGDSIHASIEKEKHHVAQEEKTFLAQKKEIEDSISQSQDRLQVLESQRKQINVYVNPSHLGRYERILENKNGLALVAVKNHACGGCYMNVPEQVINEIKMHDRFVVCEMCARILYLEDDL